MDNFSEVALRRLRCWINYPGEKDILQARLLDLELGQIGFKLLPSEEFTAITKDDFDAAIDILATMRGGNVNYVPLFSNFPDELPNDRDYLIRRILEFIGSTTFFDRSKFGADPVTQMQNQDLWDAAVIRQCQCLEDSNIEWIMLTLVSPNEAQIQLSLWVSQLIYGLTPIKEALWEDIFTVLGEIEVDIKIEDIKIKETLARLAANHWQISRKIIVRTPTDLLRMLASIQGQDVSLSQPIVFKGLKLSKPQRREIIAFLNRCPALAEDLLRYKKLWISLSRWLHPGDFVKQFPLVASVFDDLRNDRIKSFESLILNSPADDRIEQLLTRHSILLRKLTWLLKEHHPEVIAQAILKLEENIENLPIPLLVTVYCAVKYEGDRLVINKSGKPRAIGRRNSLGDVSIVLEALDRLILKKLAGSKDWSTVWIDPAIDKLILPLQARKQSDGLLNLARGSRITIDTDVIRLFIYWQEHEDREFSTDLDLSAMKLNDEFQFISHIGWNNYGGGNDLSHSGDIQSAPLGSAEFIDVKLSALTNRYILPSILRYSGEEFSTLKSCSAGWMNRNDVGSEMKTFDAKTVCEKVTVNQNGNSWVPFIIDVIAKELIYVDLYSKGSRIVEGNRQFPLIAARLASYSEARPTFGALARWYARANHATISSRQDAQVTIGMSDECSINVLKLVGQGVTSF
jgi:hypothetical protein